MIDFHAVPTPNGMKVAIMLEELGLPFRRIEMDLLGGEHLTPEFRQINPNLKAPAISLPPVVPVPCEVPSDSAESEWKELAALATSYGWSVS